MPVPSTKTDSPTEVSGENFRPIFPVTAALMLVLSLIAVGCGDGRPSRLPMSGQVLIDGEPLTFGSVQFVPTNARPSVAKLDEEGRFTLSCYGEKDGIVPGVHRVQVNAAEWISDNERKWHAPPKYFRYQTSGITQEVTETTEAVVINLTWNGKKPFVEKVR